MRKKEVLTMLVEERNRQIFARRVDESDFPEDIKQKMLEGIIENFYQAETLMSVRDAQRKRPKSKRG